MKLKNRWHPNEARLILYSILFFILVYVYLPFPSNFIDKDAEVYYNEYIELVKNNCDRFEDYINISHKIHFVNLTDENIGLCYKRANRFEIEIDKKSWLLSSDGYKRSLVFHELSHCIFGIDHSSDNLNYMYFQDTGYYTPEIKNQVINDIKENCK